MNGTEQSDSSIIPRKSANKAARAAAEPMEGSGGTKRNAGLQSSVRTQSREAVSQAQDRIREAVTRNRKERLTALLHHVSTDCLRWAFYNLKKRAAPGVDEVTWDQYAENLEANLVDLSRCPTYPPDGSPTATSGPSAAARVAGRKRAGATSDSAKSAQVTLTSRMRQVLIDKRALLRLLFGFAGDHSELRRRPRERLPGLGGAVHHRGNDLVTQRPGREVCWDFPVQRPEI